MTIINLNLVFGDYDDYKYFKVNFLKFGMLYKLLEGLIIGKINLDGAYIKPLKLISGLFIGYNNDISTKT